MYHSQNRQRTNGHNSPAEAMGRMSGEYQAVDYGMEPFAVNIKQAALHNQTFRTALWTGSHLQVTLMCIPVGGDIGLELHPHLDQFIRLEQGVGLVQMGNRRDNLYYQAKVCADYAFIIPAGSWHNLTNIGRVPLKLYSIYAPPQHPKGTVHLTKQEAEEAELMYEEDI